jgi:hypothetical protein
MNRSFGRRRNASRYAWNLIVLLVTLSLLGAVELVGPSSSEAGCTAREKAELARAGYKKAEIEQQCAKDKDDGDDGDDSLRRTPRSQPSGPRQSSAMACQTTWGTCRLNVLLPVGASCACYMPTGVFPGVAR